MRKYRFSFLALLVLVFLGVTAGQAQKRGGQYNFISYFSEEMWTVPGVGTEGVVFFENAGSTDLTLSATLAGDSHFRLVDYDVQQNQIPFTGVTIPAYQRYIAYIAFDSAAAGVYTAVLTVTDGTASDVVTITTTVEQMPSFSAYPYSDPFWAEAGIASDLGVGVYSNSGAQLQMTAVLTGGPEFTLVSPAQFTLDVNGYQDLQISFLSSTKGRHTATLTLSDGTTSQDITLNVDVDTWIIPGTMFTLETDYQRIPGAKEAFLMFELPDSLTKKVKVTNISGGSLDFKTTLDQQPSFFTVSDATFTLADGDSKVLSVTYTGPMDQWLCEFLWISGSNDNFITEEEQPVFLNTIPPPTVINGGLDVPYYVDFGIVDTNTTKCMDIVVKNTNTYNVTISNINLSGFSSTFTLTPMNTPIVIGPNQEATIQVCFRPVMNPFQEYEVLTFDYEVNGGSNEQGTIWVDLVGVSNVTINPKPSPCVIGWFEDLPVTPLGSEKEFVVKLMNFGNDLVTLNSATFTTLVGGEGVYSVVSSLPMTLSVMDPSLPASGRGELTMKYYPRSPGSVANSEDISLMTLYTDRPFICGDPEFLLVGMPEDSMSAPQGITPLFPQRNTSAVVNLQPKTEGEIHTITFFNNLKTNVVINSIELQNGTSIQIAGFGKTSFPLTIAPNAEIKVMLELVAKGSDIYNDKLVIRSSHEHLNKEFQVFAKRTGVVGVGEVPAVADIQINIAPNPSNGPVKITATGAQSVAYEIVDLMGRKLAEYKNGAEWQWNGKDQMGNAIVPGTYFVRATGVRSNGQSFSTVRQLINVK